MTLNIATHNKIFHADEVTAVALLRLFTEDEIIVHRIDHDTEDFTPYDMVIDISKQFDGDKYFDHHQNYLFTNILEMATALWFEHPVVFNA